MGGPTAVLDRETKRRLANVTLLTSGTEELPSEVQQLLAEAERQAGGDLTVAIDCLQERLIADPTVAAQRALLVHWLVRSAMASWLLRQGWRPADHDPRAWCPPQPLPNTSH